MNHHIYIVEKGELEQGTATNKWILADYHNSTVTSQLQIRNFFQVKSSDTFSYLSIKHTCGYSLEVPQ